MAWMQSHSCCSSSSVRKCHCQCRSSLICSHSSGWLLQWLTLSTSHSGWVLLFTMLQLSGTISPGLLGSCSRGPMGSTSWHWTSKWSLSLSLSRLLLYHLSSWCLESIWVCHACHRYLGISRIRTQALLNSWTQRAHQYKLTTACCSSHHFHWHQWGMQYSFLCLSHSAWACCLQSPHIYRPAHLAAGTSKQDWEGLSAMWTPPSCESHRCSPSSRNSSPSPLVVWSGCHQYPCLKVYLLQCLWWTFWTWSRECHPHWSSPLWISVMTNRWACSLTWGSMRISKEAYPHLHRLL